MGKTALRSRIRLSYVKEYTRLNTSSHYTYTANVNQAAASHREKGCAQNTVQAVERGKWAVKYTVHSMQALRPFRHNDPLQLKLSTWLRRPCPGRMPWSSGGSTPLCCLAMMPLLFPGPALQATVTSGPCCEWASCKSHGTSLVPTAQRSDRLTAGWCSPALPPHSSATAPVVAAAAPCLQDMSLKHCIELCQCWLLMAAGGQAHSPEQEHMKLPTGQPTRTQLSVPLDLLGLNRAHYWYFFLW